MRNAWQGLFSPRKKTIRADEPARTTGGDQHLELARESLRDLLQDARVPEQVREELAADYSQVEVLLERLEHEQVHIAVFGRVSVGKSALINALLGEDRFRTSPLHGETVDAQGAHWTRYSAGNVMLIDTPGIDEVAGETRERLAREVAVHSDLVVFVVDGDITATELQALRELAQRQNQLVLALNKADRYRSSQLEQLLDGLRQQCADVVPAAHIVACSAQPAPTTVIRIDRDGNEQETERQPAADVGELRDLLWRILDQEGKSLAAVNAGLFAGELSDQVAQRILEVRQSVAERVIRNYALGKGLGVALNPIPVADLLALAADGAMIMHLGRVYGVPVTRSEAGALIRTIAAQITLLMGTVWGVSLLSSVLKGVSLGLSTLITASAQGAVAYYGSYVIGRAANSYFAQGRSWGPGGAKQTVRKILADIDGDTVLANAREDILQRLRRSGKSTA